MIRLGVMDFDSCHSVEFIKRINHKVVEEDQWVDGAKVVAGCSFPSVIQPQQQIDDYVAESRNMGVEIVENPEEMIGMIDGVLLLSDDGDNHYERALPLIEAGVPMFIDKPLTYSVRQATHLFRLAEEKSVPVFSASSLRYGPEVVEVSEGSCGRIVSATAFSPANPQRNHPGLWYYGIHGVETLYGLMGPGCETLRCVSNEICDIVMAEWRDGRLATVYGMRASTHSYGFTVWGEKSISQKFIDANYIYRELLKKVIEMFKTGVPPVSASETLEIITFLAAAVQSSKEDSRRIKLSEYED